MAGDFTTDVLICGAGAAGLTLAIELARRNVAFRLIEKMDQPFQGSRGKGIQPRSQEIFEDLGILDRIVAAGGPYPPKRIHREGGADDSLIVEHFDPTIAEPYVAALMLPQFMTEGFMRERLTELGHHVHFGFELVGIEQDAAGVTARVTGPKGEETIRARYLVGTDGGRSFVRHTLNIGFPGQTLGIRALVADVVLEGLPRDAWHHFAEGKPQQLSMCPLQGTDFFQIQGPIPLEGDIDLSPAGLTAMIAARTGRKDIVVHSVAWASAYNMNARLADHYQVDRIFLAGDAAHIHPPTGGQGLNTSLQDSYNLGWKLSAVLAGAPDKLLATYEEERRPIAAGVLGLATKILETYKAPREMRRGRETLQLDLNYRESSLAPRNPARTHGVMAGDRAPDAALRGAAGQAARAFLLFKGTHWTLLGYDVAKRLAVAPRAGLHIHAIGAKADYIDDGNFQTTYGVALGDWVLVRPDGYIGAIVASKEMQTLEGYLASVGLVP